MPFSLMVNVAELAGKVTCPSLAVRRKVLAGIVGVYPYFAQPTSPISNEAFISKCFIPAKL